jgi:hypothetical protein
MNRFGGTAWGARRGGRLKALERAAMTFALVRRRVAARFGRIDAPDLCSNQTNIALPDSRLTRDALALSESECVPAVFNHSLRCFALGCLLADRKSLRFDRESFAVAALLHDVELGRTDRRDGFACVCFACAGAERARRFLKSQEVDARRSDLICEAIAMHLNAEVHPRLGTEAYLLNAAAALDVVGAGLRSIHLTDREHVLTNNPREGFERAMLDAMKRERDSAPNTRAGLQMWFGFGKMIAEAPLS